MNRYIITSLLVVFFSSLSVYGQLGVNTSTPDPSAALDIHSPNPSDQRGVLLPRMSSTERDAIINPAQGLLVLDTTDNLFYYYNGTNWCGLVPKQETITYSNNPQVKGVIALDSGSVVAPHADFQVADIDSANIGVMAQLQVTGFSYNALVPSGGIIMWSGSVVTLPPGWALCDGRTYWSNGVLFDPMGLDYGLPLVTTPNLRGRFIVGYDATVPTSAPAVAPPDGSTVNYGTIGNRGGTIGVVMTKDNLPKHQHVIGNGTDGSTMSNPGNHDHGVYGTDTNAGGSGTSAARISNPSTYNQTGYTSGNGNHIHTGVTGDGTSDGLAATPVENRAPYYVLAFIIKLP